MYVYNVYIQYCAGISQAVFIYTILMIIILTWSHWDPPDIQSLQQVSLVLTFASMKPWTSTHQTIQDWRFETCYQVYVWPREVVRIQIFPPFFLEDKSTYLHDVTPDFQISRQNQWSFHLQLPSRPPGAIDGHHCARERASVGKKISAAAGRKLGNSEGATAEETQGSREPRCNRWRQNRYWSLPKNVGASTKPSGQTRAFWEWRTAVIHRVWSTTHTPTHTDRFGCNRNQ